MIIKLCLIFNGRTNNLITHFIKKLLHAKNRRNNRVRFYDLNREAGHFILYLYNIFYLKYLKFKKNYKDNI